MKHGSFIHPVIQFIHASTSIDTDVTVLKELETIDMHDDASSTIPHDSK